MRSALLALAALGWAATAVAEAPVGTYYAYIGPEDLYNSNGERLGDAASIVRQDRANVHRFGIVHEGDSVGDDRWFFQAGAREAMPGMIAAGGLNPATARMIVEGTVYISVTIYAEDGNFTSLRVAAIENFAG